MKDLKREILSDVASHKISPEEAAARLEALEAEPQSEPSAATLDAPPAMPAGPVKRIRVVSTIGSAEIIGDSNVAYVTAEGEHRARQEGDTMVIEHAPFEESDHFVFGHRGIRYSNHGGSRYINGVDVHRRRMTIRMNPDLPLVANVQAGSLRVGGVHSTIDAEVQAGSCKIDDFRGPLNIVVQAGSVTARGLLDAGESKIRCEMGSVKVHLTKGSSVRITARSTLGRISAEGHGEDAVSMGESGKQVTIGSGAAKLDIESTMGSVKLSSD